MLSGTVSCCFKKHHLNFVEIPNFLKLSFGSICELYVLRQTLKTPIFTSIGAVLHTCKLKDKKQK